ncbi:MAG: hypothetical protein JNM42_04120 [Propionivibrio sp.]|uniref:hypothetical protein n=1 Tax=Propionivibrio sp. TaxID=2212460 RepID=UPI001A57E124|nr:hypothetical protein [Propionivibrio sp.]MBL8413607.1 hypothetical protein [Propionivibrio sp.]
MKTVNEIGLEYGVHPSQVGLWNKEIQEQVKTLFEGMRGPKLVAAHQEPALLYSEIGKLKVQLDWLNKSQGSACHDPARVDRPGSYDGRGSAMRSGWRIARHSVCPEAAETGR